VGRILRATLGIRSVSRRSRCSVLNESLAPALPTLAASGQRHSEWEEGRSATLYQRPDLVACKKTLVNYGALGYADIDYSIIGFKS